jgi:prevent-host-death family protein
MVRVNIHEAKTHLSRLLERVEGGEEVVIARAGKPIARLVPFDDDSAPRTLGVLYGQIRVGDDFDAPLPPEVLTSFGVDT